MVLGFVDTLGRNGDGNGSEKRSCQFLSSAFSLSCVSLPGAADTPTSREVAERVTVHYHRSPSYLIHD